MKEDQFEKGLFESGRNIIGSGLVLLSVAFGLWLGSLAFHPTHAVLLDGGAVALVVAFSLYAEAYHRSVVNSISLRRFCLSVVASTLPAGFIMGLFAKIGPF